MPSTFFYIAMGFAGGAIFLYTYIWIIELNWKRLLKPDLKEIFDKVEEGFEGTAVEFCEKHGNASYTGFKECLKILKERLKQRGLL